jgi:hypothetical protein
VKILNKQSAPTEMIQPIKIFLEQRDEVEHKARTTLYYGVHYETYTSLVLTPG